MPTHTRSACSTLREEAWKHRWPGCEQLDETGQASEWCRGHANGFDAALREYGDWEIVEGKVAITDGRRWCSEGRVYVVPEPQASSADWQADAGDRVKLLVPPPKVAAERDQLSQREKRMDAALRKIADWADDWLSPDAAWLRDEARRALEEPDDDSR